MAVFVAGFGGQSIPCILKSPFIYDFTMTLDTREVLLVYFMLSMGSSGTLS